MEKLQTGVATNLDFIRKMAEKGITVKAELPAETLAKKLTEAGENNITMVSPYEPVLENVNAESAVMEVRPQVLSAETTLLGKRVDEMVTDLVIEDSGSVKGNFIKVDNFTDFSSIPDEQSGYYFPFGLDGDYSKITITKNEEEPKEFDQGDKTYIFRVSQEDTFKLVIDDTQTITFTFTEATFAE